MHDALLASQKFWRLLGDYERLTANEGAALAAQDFDSAREFQASKAALLGTMRELARDLGLNAQEAPLREHVERLNAMERRHQLLVAKQQQRAELERRQLAQARARLRSLEHSYAEDEVPAPRRAFFAQG